MIVGASENVLVVAEALRVELEHADVEDADEKLVVSAIPFG